MSAIGARFAPLRPQHADWNAFRIPAVRVTTWRKELTMPRGDKSSYTGKQKRKAEHIEEGYEKRGVGKREAERRAWATVNKETGGGKKSGSGRGKIENRSASRKGGKKGGKKGGAASRGRTRTRSSGRSRSRS
jgi:plasmid stabilization system protein ParE